MTTYTAKHKAYYEANKERILSLRLERERAWIKTPKGRYSIQKRSAKKRGIEWHYTFETWWEKWQESGNWDNRGCTRGSHVMSRYNDIGPYSPENTYINLSEANVKEVYLRHGIDSKGRFNSKKDIG